MANPDHTPPTGTQKPELIKNRNGSNTRDRSFLLQAIAFYWKTELKGSLIYPQQQKITTVLFIYNSHFSTTILMKSGANRKRRNWNTNTEIIYEEKRRVYLTLLKTIRRRS